MHTKNEAAGRNNLILIYNYKSLYTKFSFQISTLLFCKRSIDFSTGGLKLEIHSEKQHQGCDEEESEDWS